MDTSAYLRSHGWRGDGHSLDQSNRGLKKALLVSKKVDVLGVGLNKHAAVSDQWWLRAFDEGLKNLGKGGDTVLGSIKKHGVNRGGLYGRFVKGEGVPGTIGQLGLEKPPASTSTPLTASREKAVKMAKVTKPSKKGKRVLAKVNRIKPTDPMLQLLRNPEDVPRSMAPLLARKRKFAERGPEKRARRKLEHSGKLPNGEDAGYAKKKQAAIEAGTFDYEAEQKRQQEKLLNLRIKDMLLDAQRRGFIPTDRPDDRQAPEPSSTGPDDGVAQAAIMAGLPIQATGRMSEKSQKLVREKAKRTFKRAARAYITGEPMPVVREKAKKSKAEGRAKARAKILKDKEAAEKRKIKKAKIKAEKEAEKELAREAQANSIDLEADEVNLNGEAVAVPKQKKKKVPGLGVVDKYPTKAEKRANKLAAIAAKQNTTLEAVEEQVLIQRQQDEVLEKEKVDRYRGAKLGLSLEEYRAKVATGEIVHPKDLKRTNLTEKISAYAKRAAEKGVTVEEYIKRRKEKYAERRRDKYAAKMKRKGIVPKWAAPRSRPSQT